MYKEVALIKAIRSASAIPGVIDLYFRLHFLLFFFVHTAANAGHVNMFHRWFSLTVHKKAIAASDSSSFLAGAIE